MSLATTIIVQLLTSQFMTYSKIGRPGDWLFEIHQYSGLLALSLSLFFLLILLFRRRDTPLSLMFPWLSTGRRQALSQDLKGQLQTLKSMRLPYYHAENPLASAVHGLGLLLIALMATTGGIYFLALDLGLSDSTWAGLDKDLHESLGGLVWAYLIGHSGIAMVTTSQSNLTSWKCGRLKNNATVK